MNKPNRTNDKRRRILDGALRAFARKGFYNTKVSEIASEAGVADGTIYLYFKNKDDLLISLFEDRMEWINLRLRTELEAVPGGVVEQLKAFVHLHFKLVLEHAELAEFITVELRQSAKFVKEYKNPKFGAYLRILQELIERGQSEGVIRADMHARMIARAVFGALDELLLQLTLSKAGPAEVERTTTMLSELLLSGLIGPKESPNVQAPK